LGQCKIGGGRDIKKKICSLVLRTSYKSWARFLILILLNVLGNHIVIKKKKKTTSSILSNGGAIHKLEILSLKKTIYTASIYNIVHFSSVPIFSLKIKNTKS
jgi:hypothetical protein